MLADPTLLPRILLLTGVFLCPVVFDRGAFAPFDLPKITVLWSFSLAALGLWSIEVLRGRTRPVSYRLGVMTGLFVLAFGIATLSSRTPVVSFFGSHLRSSGFLEYTLYAVISFLIAQLYWRRPDRLGELIYALAAAAAVAVVYVVVQWLGLDPFSWPGKRARFGTLGNSNFTGGFIGATSPLLLFAFWRARRLPWRAPVVVWGAVTVWALLLTESRGGLAALGLGAVALAVAFRPRLSRRMLAATVAVVVLGAVVLAVMATRPLQSRPDVSVPGTRDVLRTDTLEIRTYWWRAALSVFASSPLVGTGPETFAVAFPRYMPVEAAGKVQLGAGAEAADKPHNVFFDHAASTGLLGLGAYGVLLGAAMFWGLRRMRRAPPREADLLGTFLAVVAGYAGQAFFSIDIPPLAIVLWAGLGGIAALADPRLVALRESGSRAPMRRPRRMTVLRWGVIGLVALVTAVAIAGGTRPWLAERASRAALDATDREDFAAARRRYDEAIALYPVDPVHHMRAGSALLKRAERLEGDQRSALIRRAVGYFERADGLQPGYHVVKLALGEALSRLAVSGEHSVFYDAGVAFDEAADLAPNDWRVFVRSADMLNRWGRAEGATERHCAALEQLDRALELRYGDPDAWRSLAVSYTYLGQFERALDAIQRSLVIDPDSGQSRRIQDEVLERSARGGTRIEC